MDPSSRSPDWLVRLESGRLVSFRELTTLQKWIVEGRIGREDAISRDGRTWKRLGSIGELDAFFTVYERSRRRSEGASNGADEAPVRPVSSVSVSRMTAMRGLPRRSPSSETGAKTPLHRPTPASPARSQTVPPESSRGSISGIYGAGLALPARPLSRSEPGPDQALPPEPSLSPVPPSRGEIFPQPSLSNAMRSPVVAPAAFPSALPADPDFAGNLSFVGPVPVAKKVTAKRILGGIFALVAAMLVGVLVGVGLAQAGFADLRMTTPYDSSSDISEARKAMQLDTPSGRARAERILEAASDQASKPHPALLVTEAELLLRRAAAAVRQADDDEAESERLDVELAAWRSTIRASRGDRGRTSLPPRPEVADPNHFRRQARITREEATKTLNRAGSLLQKAREAGAEASALPLPLAALALARGDLEAAERRLGDVGGSGSQAYLQSRIAAARGHKSDQFEALRRAVEWDPSHLRARVELAELEVEAGRSSQASRLLARVLEDAPDHLEAQALQARLEQRTVRVERKRVARPKSYEEWLTIAGRAHATGRSERALAAFTRATMLAPTRTEGHLGRAETLRALGRGREAADAYERFLIVAGPEDPDRNTVEAELDALRAAEPIASTATVAER